MAKTKEDMRQEQALRRALEIAMAKPYRRGPLHVLRQLHHHETEVGVNQAMRRAREIAGHDISSHGERADAMELGRLHPQALSVSGGHAQRVQEIARSAARHHVLKEGQSPQGVTLGPGSQLTAQQARGMGINYQYAPVGTRRRPANHHMRQPHGVSLDAPTLPAGPEVSAARVAAARAAMAASADQGGLYPSATQEAQERHAARMEAQGAINRERQGQRQDFVQKIRDARAIAMQPARVRALLAPQPQAAQPQAVQEPQAPPPAAEETEADSQPSMPDLWQRLMQLLVPNRSQIDPPTQPQAPTQTPQPQTPNVTAPATPAAPPATQGTHIYTLSNGQKIRGTIMPGGIFLANDGTRYRIADR